MGVNLAFQAPAATEAPKDDKPAEAAAEAQKEADKQAAAAEKESRRRAKEDPSVVEQVVGSGAFKSMLRSAGTVIGREISRSIFGTRRKR